MYSSVIFRVLIAMQTSQILGAFGTPVLSSACWANEPELRVCLERMGISMKLRHHRRTASVRNALNFYEKAKRGRVQKGKVTHCYSKGQIAAVYSWLLVVGSPWYKSAF